MTEQVCGHEKDDGAPCRVGFGLCDDPSCDCGKCYSHCPAREDERRAARERGGATTAEQRRKYTGVETTWALESIEDAKSWLERIGRLVLAKKIAPKQAHAAIRAVTAWLEAERDHLASEELEELRQAAQRLRKSGTLKAI